jgi:PAS domain-containing protein
MGLDKFVKAHVDNSLNFALLLDSKLKVVYHSDNLRSFLGIANSSTLVGLSAIDLYKRFYDEKYAEGAFRRLSRLSEKSEFFEDVPIALPTGEKRINRITYKRIVGPDDGLESILVFSQDITGLRLEEAEQRINDILHSSTLPCLVWDGQGNVLACNSDAMRVFDVSEGTTPEDLQKIISSQHPEFQPDGRKTEVIRQELVREALEKGFAQHSIQLKGKRGIPRHFRVNIARIPWPFGYRLVTYFYDTTNHFKKEMELAHAREMSELQLAKLNLVVQASKIGLWDMEVVQNDPVNPENVFTWSDEFRYMLGFSGEQDFPNVLASWSDRLHPEDKERTLDAFSPDIS